MFTVSVNGGPASAAAPWTGTHGLGVLQPGDSVVIVITATVDPATPDNTTLTNTTTATSPTDDPNPTNNSDTETTHVDTEADLDIDKTAPLTATAGDPAGFDFSISVDNDGPSDNTGGFTVSDTLASGLTYVDALSDPRCSAARPGRDLRQHGRPRGQRR